MKRLEFTLISDGPTDAVLIPIIEWTLRESGGVEIAEGIHADLWRLSGNPRTLKDRIIKAVEWYPRKVLFIHRDAEKEDPASRLDEIRTAVASVAGSGCCLPVVSVIPVRMSEAWLLFNESAIRQAAGNPNGTVWLDLPPLNRLEDRPDPKSDLLEALRLASELRGRRLKKFNDAQAVRRVGDFLNDFSPLRELPAFLAFENTVRQIQAHNWAPGSYPIAGEPLV